MVYILLINPLGAACVGLVGSRSIHIMETISVEDKDSVIEVRLIKSTWLQINQIWKDDEDEENVIFVHQGQVSGLIKALKETKIGI